MANNSNGIKKGGFNIANIHFVTANLKEEVQVIKMLKPSHLLLSYWYFKKVDLIQWVADIGYKPTIILDSGAWSAFNKGKKIVLKEYMSYIRKNWEVIDEFISLDVIGQPFASLRNWLRMQKVGLYATPVFHYQDHTKWLDAYTKVFKVTRLALGGTVVEKSKNKVADWAETVLKFTPNVSFHILGTSSKVVHERLTQFKNVTFDSSTWVLMAVNGWPKSIPGRDWDAKIARMVYHMNEIRSRFGEVEACTQLPSTHLLSS